mmetsp:Transcript_29700/g.52016  ORF Transcript_29700/g.52016 Transcript_29700/m.52016 type:complete len:80 (+) Transcript_29700:359-598(+)
MRPTKRIQLIASVQLLFNRVVFEEPFREIINRIIGLDFAYLDQPLCQRRNDILHQVMSQWGRTNFKKLSFFLLQLSQTL